MQAIGKNTIKDEAYVMMATAHVISIEAVHVNMKVHKVVQNVEKESGNDGHNSQTATSHFSSSMQPKTNPPILPSFLIWAHYRN